MSQRRGLRRAPRWIATGLLAALALPAAAVPDTLAQRLLACTTCHGSADRQTPQGYVPRIAGKPVGYLAEQLRHFRDGRRPHDGMARLLAHLDDRYLGEIAGHFAAQRSGPWVPDSAPVSADMAQRAQRWLQRGDDTLGVPACSACHGAALTGAGPNVPGLLGLPAGYLAAQLGAWRQGLRQARPPDCMARIARALPAEDIPALTRWLAAQPLPIAAAPAASPPAAWPAECGSLAP